MISFFGQIIINLTCIATNDATLFAHTVRGKAQRHWSAENTRVFVFQCQGLSRFNTADAVCMFGRMCHHASTYSHRDAHETVVSIEPLHDPTGDEASWGAAKLCSNACVV